MPTPTAAAAATASVPARALRLGAIAAVACVAQFMIVLDSSIVTVALPAMRTSLNLSAEQQQWVINSYLVALGGLLLLAARIGDLAGHRRVFRIGLVVFTLASLAGGLATNGTLLVASRAVQGAGAAALAPSSLSLITTTHTEAARRVKALALWSLMGGAARRSRRGPQRNPDRRARLALGVVRERADRRRAVRRFRPRPAPGAPARRARTPARPARRAAGHGRRHHLDLRLLPRAVGGWTSAPVIGSLIAAPVLLALFVLVETRSPMPLVPLSFFRSRRLSVGNSIMFCLGATMTSAFVFITLYQQQCLGYSALRSGLALVPITIVLVAGTLLSRPLLPVIGPRVLLAGGALITAAGLIWISGLPTHSAYPLHVLGPTVVAGFGISCMLLSVTVAATSGVDPKNAGSASGLITTSRQIGGALGLAVLTSIADFAARSAGTADPIAAAVHGYRVAFLANAGIMLLAAFVALILPREPRRS